MHLFIRSLKGEIKMGNKNYQMIPSIDLTKLKEKSQEEKQLLVEIYKMAFEHFLRNVFTIEFLQLRIKEEVDYSNHFLTFRFTKDNETDECPISYIVYFAFENMIEDLFLYKWLKKTLGFALVKNDFKHYKKSIIDNFIHGYSKLTLLEIKELVIDQSETWQLLLKIIENENIKYDFYTDKNFLVFKMEF